MDTLEKEDIQITYDRMMRLQSDEEKQKKAAEEKRAKQIEGWLANGQVVRGIRFAGGQTQSLEGVEAVYDEKSHREYCKKAGGVPVYIPMNRATRRAKAAQQRKKGRR